ncbi:MAG: GNAT family N-acetyltransferase [Asticcacaulis sp.]
MLTCDLIRSADLTVQDETEWRTLTRANAAFNSPLLSPEFFHAVARIRSDAHVAVFRKNGQTVGFLAHHRRPNGFARPIGAPFSDYTALITGPDADFTIQEALEKAHIRQLQVIGLIDPYNVFAGINGTEDTAYGFDFTLPDNIISPKRSKNIRRREQKLVNDYGPLRFHVGDRDPLTFERMLTWKRAQTHQTGISDFLAPKWIQALMHDLFALPPESPLQGHMTSLYAGDRLVACKFGVRLGDYLHSWISTYDPTLRDYSPGLLFLVHAREALTAEGVRVYDMATGSPEYKGVYCNDIRTVSNGRAFASSPLGQRDKALSQWYARRVEQFGGRPASALRRLGRRMDQIATLELDTPNRIAGMAHAILSAPQRLKSSG